MMCVVRRGVGRIGLAAVALSIASTAGCSLLFDEGPGAEARDGGIVADGGDGTQTSGDFFIGPEGDDGNAGTRDAPFLTWRHAISQLSSGQVLVALSGDYPQEVHGDLDIGCNDDSACEGGPCRNGGAQAISIIADRQREAVIRASGARVAAPVRIRECLSWRVMGLRVSGSDAQGADGFDDSALVLVHDSENIELRDLLLHDSNRYLDAGLLRVRGSANVLIDRLEGYRFHSDAVLIEQSANVEMSRGYLHGRDGDFADLPDGIASRSGCEARGDIGVIVSGCAESYIDNLVVEEVCDGIRIEPDVDDSSSDNVVISGSMVRNATRAAYLAESLCDRECPTEDCEVCDPTAINNRTLISNSLAVSSNEGFKLSGVVELGLVNVSSFDNSSGVLIEQGAPLNGLLEQAVTISSSSLVGNSIALEIADDADFPVLLSHLHRFGNNSDQQGSSAELKSEFPLSDDPALGACQAYLPPSSPLQTAAMGAAVGANILTRSFGGQSVEEPLWSAQGAFPCGADTPEMGEERCHNLHERFFVGDENCPVPDP